MNLKKCLVAVTFITCMALLYVHQRVELIKVGYEVRGAEKDMYTLLERHRNLVYNITSLTSAPHLDSVLLADNTYMKFPEKDQVRLFVEAREMEAAEGDRRHAFSIVPPAYAESLNRQP